jgi:hypothetical protein
MNREQFYSKKKIEHLSAKEKEKRWKQHRAAKTSARARPGYNRNTKIKVHTVDGKNYGSMRLTHCASEYANCLIMPFTLHKVACIPDLHAVPSKKLRIVLRGTFSTGTGGYGHLLQSPWCGAKDANQVNFTTASYALGETLFNVGAGMSAQVAGKLPYGVLQWAGNVTGGIKHRLVGSGLRIRYIGPESSRSGQIVAFREPDNDNLDTLTYNRVRELETSATFRNTGEWQYVMYRPAKPSEYEYSPNPCATNDIGLSAVSSYRTQGFTITGTTDINGNPSPAPFEYELVSFFEFIGNVSAVTRTHVDLTGMSHVRNALPVKSVTDAPIQYVKQAARAIGHSLAEAAPAVGAGALGAHLISGGTATGAATIEEAAETTVPLLEYLPQGIAEGGGFLAEAAEMAEAILPFAAMLL